MEPQPPEIDVFSSDLAIRKSTNSAYDVHPAEQAATGPKTPLLNTMMLLRILSYVDPETLCRFSWTCSWAKEFVDANINRLPRPELADGRIVVTPSSTKYALTFHRNFKVQTETATFDIDSITANAKFVVIRNLSIIFNSVEPPYSRSTIETLFNAGVVPDIIQWNNSTVSFQIAHSCFNSDSQFATCVRNLLVRSLDAIFDISGYTNFDRKIEDLLVTALRSSFFVEINLSDSRGTIEECFSLFAQMLKVVVDEKIIHEENKFCGFPKIVFRTPDAAPFLRHEESSLLMRQLEKKGLTACCSLEWDGNNFDSLILRVAPWCKDMCLDIIIYLTMEIMDDFTSTLVIKAANSQLSISHGLRKHKNRPSLLNALIDELGDLYSYMSATEKKESLHEVLEAMKKYPENGALQNSGSDVLRTFALSDELIDEDMCEVLLTLLNAMEIHINDKVLVDRCMQTIKSDDATNFLSLNCERTAQVLCAVIRNYAASYTSTVAILVLCKLSHIREQRWRFEGTDAAMTVLRLIDRKRKSNECDEAAAEACRFLLNITDMQPGNSARIVEADGLPILWEFYQKFHRERQMPLDLIGIMGNIAEVKGLKCHLMKNEYIDLFCMHAAASADNMEASFIAAKILVHLVDSGDEAWKGLTLTRELAMEKITKAIATWNYNTMNTMNYNSLQPFLEFVPMFDSPACQHYAVWALANLTTTERNKYCERLSNEGGSAMLEEVQNDVRTADDVRTLISITLDNFYAWKRVQWQVAHEELAFVDDEI